MIGTTVSHYRILASVGSGGMGVVYLAEDTRLNRKVALKFLPPAVASDGHTRARFLREAQTASALDQPNIATVYDVGDWNEQLFIAMPYYDGETLRQRIERGPLPISEATAIAMQIATGLAAAHRAGIVHRDLKPANVMLTRDGQVKILDFGLAKVLSATDATATRMTAAGITVGTVAYMAPEQAVGGEVDARADIWAFGVTLFEMLAGRLPFAAESAPAMMLAIVTQPPPSVRDVRPDVPEVLDAILQRTLERDVARRTMSAAEIASQIAESQARASGSGVAARVPATFGRSWKAIAGIALGIAVLTGGWFVRQSARTRWAREQALPEIERLVEAERYVEAFRRAADARQVIPTDPAWTRLDPILIRRASIITTPAGATACYRSYEASDPWTCLGETPIRDASVPNAVLTWRIDKAGFVAAEDLSEGGIFNSTTTRVPATFTLQFTLHPAKDVPPGMVHVPANNLPLDLSIPGMGNLQRVTLRDFWIDRTEVTNRDFKRFVDGGGYRDQRYWRAPFVKNGTALSFDAAMALFKDSSGRPGPATWVGGSYPSGHDDHPVSGVSWYEAAAYAAFVGKSLPTLFHWSRVAGLRLSGAIVPRSNFGGQGPMKVGATGAMNHFGAVDLAGNVKEWSWNAADADRRFISGGAWDEPVYVFNDADARSPFERAANFGFRCVKYGPDETLAGPDRELIPSAARNLRKATPATDEQFEGYLRLYDYDSTDLLAKIDTVDESNPDWRLERVSFQAAYGNERVPALLFLPRRLRPPFQVVVYFPGAGARRLRASSQINPSLFDWVVKSGRAVIYPIYKGTYERGGGVQSAGSMQTIANRDLAIARAKDVRRTVDYLSSRPDIHRTQIAYMGQSWGAALGPVHLVVERRFKAAVLILGGLSVDPHRPEIDPFNFAPRVRLPVLLLNGRFDFVFPVETSQLPMFDAFRSPDGQKRRIVYDTGHNIPRPELIRESLDWLDTHLGKVAE